MSETKKLATLGKVALMYTGLAVVQLGKVSAVAVRDSANKVKTACDKGIARLEKQHDRLAYPEPSMQPAK